MTFDLAAFAEALDRDVDLAMSWGRLGVAAFGRGPRFDTPHFPHRYLLSRAAGGLAGRGTCLFIMLNPSTADHDENDPTIRRCIGYATAWGYADLLIGNGFALRSAKPKALYGIDPAHAIGAYNDAVLAGLVQLADLVVCGWGNHGKLHGRGAAVLEIIRAAGKTPHALRVTKAGQPEHPLYLSKLLKPEPMA